MKQKYKKSIWFLLVITFIFSSCCLPLGKSTSYKAQAATLSGYELEGIAFYASSSEGEGLLPVYRLFKSADTEHIYTTSEEKKSDAISNLGYTLEKTSFYAYPASEDGLSPVYSLYNKSFGSRLYTASEEDKDDAVKDLSYISEGIAFYASTSPQTGLVPVYQLHNKASGDYLYTASEEEKAALVKKSPAPKSIASLGPEISVGLWSASKNSLKKKPFKIKANKNYNIKDKKGNILAQVTGALETQVSTYSVTTDKKQKRYLKIDHSMPDKKLGVQEIYIDSTDGDNSNMVFDISRPGSSFDQYRGKIKIKYTNDANIWIINILPMEQYVWGMGETAGTGPREHTNVMTAIFRTYGYWYIKNATKYLPYGFRIRSDSGSQIYLGYEWEKSHPAIRQSANKTRGKIVMYKKEVALTPYSSWTDGRTRSFKERWGSKNYPWCKSVPDPYGKNKTLSTKQLVSRGNHMVGMSANGSLKLAGSGYKWNWSRILKYYYTGISITSKY